MDTQVTFAPLIVLAGIILSCIVAVLVVTFLSRCRTKSDQPRPMAVPSPPMNREQRVQILQQLADRRITVDEAESRLAALGNPVPAAIPTGGPRSSSSGVGCLIAALIVAGVLALLVFGVVALSFVGWRRAEVDFGPGVHLETLHTSTEIIESETEVTESPEAEITEETVEEWEEDTQ